LLAFLQALIKSFVGLRTLAMRNCKQLQEISEFQPNVESIFAYGCISLERFQFNIRYLSWLRWNIDLAKCHKLLGNIGKDLEVHLSSSLSLPYIVENLLFRVTGASSH
jgi:hypothetical protein